MSEAMHHVTFSLAEQRYALPLSCIDRVVRAVEVVPLPEAPSIVLGVINVQGRVVPAINMRRRLHLPEREIDVSDQIILAHTSRRAVALVVDAVGGVVEGLDGLVRAEDILAGMGSIGGVAKLHEGMTLLIHDLDSFLGLDVAERLGAIGGSAGR